MAKTQEVIAEDEARRLRAVEKIDLGEARPLWLQEALRRPVCTRWERALTESTSACFRDHRGGGKFDAYMRLRN